MLDQYGNKTKAGNSMIVNLKDATEHVSNTAISFSFSATDVCVLNSMTILGDAKDEVLKLGTADMIGHIKNQTAIADSDVVLLKIVPDQLVATNLLFAGKAPVQAGVSITKNVLGINAFQVNKDDGTFVNTGGPTTMEIRHMYNGYMLEKTEGTIGQNTADLGARFDKSSSDSATGSSYKSEYYVLATTEGTYGEVVVPAALIAVPDIIPASPSKHKMVDGHGQEITSMKAAKVPNSDPVEYRALFRENNVKMEDDYGNETSPSLPIDLLSSNGTVSNHSDLKANDTAGDMSSVTYDPTSFVGGDDLVQFVFKEPKMTGSDITVQVPVNKELTEIKLDVESDKIPVNGVVPVRVTSWDQFGEIYAHSKGIFLEIDADSSVAVRVFYVDVNGNEMGPIANNTLINNSKVNGRSVLAVYALNGTTGNFVLNVRDADNVITASQTFEITRKFEDFTVDPTEVTVISGDTAEVTLAGGTPPCLPEPVDAAVATMTVNEDCTAGTITGVSAEEAETTIMVTDADNRIVTIAVKVTNPLTEEECVAEGNVYVDGECQELPDTGGGSDGGSVAITPEGNFTSSYAMFSGGWSDGGEYQTSLTISKEGADVSAVEIIRFDPAHNGQEVEILLILSVKLSQFGSTYWYSINDKEIVGPALALDIAALEPLQTHKIVPDEPLVMGTYVLDNLILPVAEFAFYFGYRTSEGTIYFSAVPITLIVR
jgi:hypothetical protein